LPEVVLERVDADVTCSERPAEADIGGEDLVRDGEIPLVPELVIEAADHELFGLPGHGTTVRVVLG
jgi:hypothetical protein